MSEQISEISIYGELAVLFEKSLESDNTLEHNFDADFGGNPGKTEDWQKLDELLVQGKITIRALYYLYSVALKFMEKAFAKWGCDPQKDLFSEDTKRIVMNLIPVGMEAKMALGEGDEESMQEALQAMDMVTELMTSNKGFVLRIIDRAFNDALILITRKEVRQAVADAEIN